MPSIYDEHERWVDSVENMPNEFHSFIGDHNNECFSTLRMIKDGFEDTKAFPNLLMIVGPSGTGKSAIGHAFTIELCSWMSLNTNERRKKFVLWINCRKYQSDFNAMWQVLQKFSITDL